MASKVRGGTKSACERGLSEESSQPVALDHLSFKPTWETEMESSRIPRPAEMGWNRGRPRLCRQGSWEGGLGLSGLLSPQ